jgi:NarL family two-component system sensor histidine kinase YdfH
MKKQSELINTEKETRSFFWFMTMVMVLVSVWVIVSQPEVRQPLRLIPFVVLMTVQTILHWMLRYNAERPGWTAKYMVGQGFITIVLVFLGRDLALAFALSMALIGEAIGVYGISKRGILVSAYYLIISLAYYIWQFGLEQIGWMMIGVVPIFTFVIIYVEMYTRQANANDRAQELLNELETANRQLSEYAAQVEDLTIAAERQRMARELHDTLSQGLAGLILQLEAADAHLANGRTEKARQIVQQTMENARATLAKSRQAIDALRTNGSLEFKDALKYEVSRFSASSGVPCNLQVEVEPELHAELTDHLLRIVSEALSNILRYAQATQASVTLKSQNRTLLLEIKDNGIGFDPQAIPTGHYGLIGMRERARLAGGVLEVTSQPGQGVTLLIRIPLS